MQIETLQSLSICLQNVVNRRRPASGSRPLPVIIFLFSFDVFGFFFFTFHIDRQMGCVRIRKMDLAYGHAIWCLPRAPHVNECQINRDYKLTGV